MEVLIDEDNPYHILLLEMSNTSFKNYNKGKTPLRDLLSYFGYLTTLDYQEIKES